MKERARRLYEQWASIKRLRQYVSRWCRWFQGALTGLVSRKGGTKRYWVWVISHLSYNSTPKTRRTFESLGRSLTSKNAINR